MKTLIQGLLMYEKKESKGLQRDPANILGVVKINETVWTFLLTLRWWFVVTLDTFHGIFQNG